MPIEAEVMLTHEQLTALKRLCQGERLSKRAKALWWDDMEPEEEGGEVWLARTVADSAAAADLMTDIIGRLDKGERACRTKQRIDAA